MRLEILSCTKPGLVQGVYFAPKRRGLLPSEKQFNILAGKFPLFRLIRAKARENPCYFKFLKAKRLGNISVSECDNNGTKIGVCDLRIGHNENTYYGGNIGYGIDEEYRGHHYAGKACLLLFELARKHEWDYVIITCNPDNFASNM